MSFSVRAVRPNDRSPWEQLWTGYQRHYKVDLPPDVTNVTWRRFFDGLEPMHALVAEDGDTLIGLVHYLFHRSTWMTGPTCYLQDLFTLEQERGRGVAGTLIGAVYREAARAGAARIYWNTHETNARARALYDRLATRSGFIQYRKDL